MLAGIEQFDWFDPLCWWCRDWQHILFTLLHIDFVIRLETAGGVSTFAWTNLFLQGMTSKSRIWYCPFKYKQVDIFGGYSHGCLEAAGCVNTFAWLIFSSSSMCEKIKILFLRKPWKSKFSHANVLTLTHMGGSWGLKQVKERDFYRF